MATAKTVKVRFLESRKVQDEEGRVFDEGKTYDLPPDSAEHWIKRGVAELASNAKAKEAPAPAGEDK